MDCFTIFLFGIFMIIGFAQFIDWIKEKKLEAHINKALKEGNFGEYQRLVNSRSENKNKFVQTQVYYPTGMDYLTAMIVLDAAEDGVFFPGGHKVFERLENRSPNSYDDYEDSGYLDSSYYDDYYEEYDEEEYSDHWGLG